MFPELCNSTITLFNAYEVNEKITWYKTVLRGVFLNSNKQYIQSKTGATIDTNNLLVVPFNEEYVNPVEWKKLPNDKMASRWTLGVSARDFYVIGDIIESIPPYTERDIKKLYENYTIKAVDAKPNFNGGIHRFVVMGV